MAETCASDDGPWWVPLLDGVERLGVLEVVGLAAPDDRAVEDCTTVASLLAELVVTRGLYSDTIERVRRRQPMRLAAEMLRAQLPPLSYSAGHLIISGVLEPSYDVGGDAFDYAVKAVADGLPLPETARRLVHAILAHQDDRLQDDATVLLAQWRGPALPGLVDPPADRLFDLG